VKLLIDAVRASGGQRFLIDGFPRNTNNLSGWQQVAGDELTLGGVLFYDCPEETMEARLLERGKTSGRSDDNIESIKKRFRTYTQETTPILQYYDHQGMDYKIDGTRDVEVVWQSTKEAIDAIEKRFKAASAKETHVHVYASLETSADSEAIVAKAQEAALKRFGEGKVAVTGQTFVVDASLKSFDLDALRAFD